MASTVCTDTDSVPVNKRVRSLSHASHSGWDWAFSPLPSPLVPATPTNTPTSTGNWGCFSPGYLTRSPSVTSPPANTPESNLDSGVTSPRSEAVKTAKIEFHAPDFLHFHHFFSPILGPTAPPNSPVNWHLAGDAMGDAAESSMGPLGGRMAALDLARENNSGFTNDEVKILKEEIPKAPENPYYEIRTVPGKGYGCFALTDIRRGTRILSDDPLIFLPMAEYLEEDIKEAFAKLSPADQALYFTLHSAHGQDPNNWPKQGAHSSVEKFERTRIEEQHNARLAKEPSLVSIFQTNCMEMEGGATIFPHAARFNHCCNPNATFVWNHAIKKETIHAIKDIKKDEQITLSYCDMTHDKATRRWELKHYGFLCDCEACTGDLDDPDSFAAQSATRRYRLMELDEGFKLTRRQIQTGIHQPGLVEKLLEYSGLLIEEGDYTVRLAETYRDIALVCEAAEDWGNAKTAAVRALKVMLDCVGPDHLVIKNYSALVKFYANKITTQKEVGVTGE